MMAVFADTFFYVALLSRRDSRHRLALDWATQQRTQIITTQFVLLEVANFCRTPRDRKKFVEFARALDRNPVTTVIPCDSNGYHRGLERFSLRSDKEWSLTDCISFVVMEDHALNEVLTNDRHFEQAGFTVLL